MLYKLTLPLTVLAFVAAIGGALFVLFGPVVQVTSCSADAFTPDTSVEEQCTTETRSLLEDGNAAVVLPVAALPVVITATALWLTLQEGRFKSWRWGLSALYFVACMITGFSIGLFFLPSSFLLLLSLAFERGVPDPPHPSPGTMPLSDGDLEPRSSGARRHRPHTRRS